MWEATHGAQEVFYSFSQDPLFALITAFRRFGTAAQVKWITSGFN